MGVDVVHLIGRETGGFQRAVHRGAQALALGVGHRDVVGVGGGGVGGDFAVDARAALFRVLQRLEHEHARTLAHDEAVAAHREGAAGGGGVVVARAHGAHGAEGGVGEGRDGGLGAAGDHHVGVAAADHVHRLADGVGAGGAGRNDAEVRPARAELDGHDAGANVADEGGDGEGRDFARAAVVELLELGLVGEHAADAGADDDADAVGVLGVHAQAGVGPGLLGRAESEVGVAVVSTRLLRVHELLDVPALHLGAHLGGEGRRVELRHAVDAVFTRHEAGPEGVGILAKAMDDAETGDDDTLGIRELRHV